MAGAVALSKRYHTAVLNVITANYDSTFSCASEVSVTSVLSTAFIVALVNCVEHFELTIVKDVASRASRERPMTSSDADPRA